MTGWLVNTDLKVRPYYSPGRRVLRGEIGLKIFGFQGQPFKERDRIAFLVGRNFVWGYRTGNLELEEDIKERGIQDQRIGG